MWVKESSILDGEVVGMFRINDMIDLPLVDSTSLHRFCTIRDVLIDSRVRKVYALVCKERFFRRSIEAVLFSNVVDISQNSVKVNDRTFSISYRELSIKHRRFQSYQDILGRLVISGRGENLGIIRDILIDTNSGMIKAYELSEGYIDDLIRGRHIVDLECGHILDSSNLHIKESGTQYSYHTNN